MREKVEELERLCREARSAYGPSSLWWLADQEPAAAGWKAIAKGLRL